MSRHFSLRTVILAVIIGLLCTHVFMACQPVKAYQKNRINDSEMQLSARKVEKPEMNFMGYREGSSGSNGGKTGGGCGCN